MHTHWPFCFPSQKPPIGDSNRQGNGAASPPQPESEDSEKLHSKPIHRVRGFGSAVCVVWLVSETISCNPGWPQNHLCNQGWPLTSYSPASTSRVCWGYKSVSPLCAALDEWIYEFRMLCSTKLAGGALEPREGKGFSGETQWISEILTSKFSFFPHTALPCTDFFAGNGPERSSIPQTKPVEQYFRVQPLQYKTSKKSYGVCASNLGKQPSSPHRENVFSE